MKNIIFALFLVFISGCGPMLQARVTQFHALPPKLNSLTFAVVPYEPQRGSLEFQAYSEQVATQLESKGLIAAPVSDANYLVFLTYSIDDGRQVAFSYPIFGQTGIASTNTQGTIKTTGNQATYSATTNYTPTYGMVGSGTGVRTNYKRIARLEILNKAALEVNSIKKIYEGEVTSSGSTGELSAVMPTLLKALLKDFPGESGRSNVVELSVQ